MEHNESDQIKNLLDSGYVDAARHRLEEILKANQHDMGAWLLYVNSFKTIDTRLEVLEICRRLNPDNLKVKSAIAALKMKKSADHAAVATPPAPSFEQRAPDRAEEQAPWSSAPASASFVQPESGEASPPAWGYETSAKDMYKPTTSLSKEEIDRQARDYVEGRVDGKKGHQVTRSADNSRSIPKWGVILGIILVVLIIVCLFVYLGYTYFVP